MEEFLRELTELSKKHKIYIWGCGCCGSPGASRKDDIPEDAEYQAEPFENGETVEKITLRQGNQTLY